MAETPSHRRRKGRNAFVPGDDPKDHYFYKGSWDYDYHFPDFLDGWKEAEKEWEEKQLEDIDICECCGQDIK